MARSLGAAGDLRDRADRGQAGSVTVLAWRGVRWLQPVNGVYPKHGTPVGPVTGLCLRCHREQLDAAAKGSNECERRP